MEIQFVKINPCENMTILVTTPIERALQPSIAEKLMAYGSVNAEQVGFLEPASMENARLRLQMMGGEFCGNATMSLAAYLAHTDDIQDSASYPLEISGSNDVLVCDIRKNGSAFDASVAMPTPEKIETVSLRDGSSYPAVFFPGIAHLIVPQDEISAEAVEAQIADWCAFLNVEALGVILADAKCESICPIVYVRATNSSVRERGCGSGTAAIGAYLAAKRRESISVCVNQPGGSITAEAQWSNDRLFKLKIHNRIRIACIGTAWVE